MFELKSWQTRALVIRPESQIFIDGEFVAAASGKTFNNFAPRDNHLIGKNAAGDLDAVNRAVASAKKVFEAGTWREMNPRDKKRIMLRWAELINANKEELALLEAVDTGRPISDALNVDVP